MTVSIEAVPIGTNLWAVKVNNGAWSDHPTSTSTCTRWRTEGLRAPDQCRPARGNISMRQLVHDVLSGAWRRSLTPSGSKLSRCARECRRGSVSVPRCRSWVSGWAARSHVVRPVHELTAGVPGAPTHSATDGRQVPAGRPRRPVGGCAATWSTATSRSAPTSSSPTRWGALAPPVRGVAGTSTRRGVVA